MSSEHHGHHPEPSVLHRHIERVGVIGAGLNGIVSAVHLLRAGFDVTVFERAKRAGGACGAWDFDPNIDRDLPYPNTRLPPSRSEAEVPTRYGVGEGEAASFAPPGYQDGSRPSRGGSPTRSSTARQSFTAGRRSLLLAGSSPRWRSRVNWPGAAQRSTSAPRRQGLTSGISRIARVQRGWP